MPLRQQSLPASCCERDYKLSQPMTWLPVSGRNQSCGCGAEPKLTRKSCGIRKNRIFYMLFGSITRAARCDFATVTACNKKGPFSKPILHQSLPSDIFRAQLRQEVLHLWRSQRFTVGSPWTYQDPAPRTCSAQSSMLYSIGGFSESPNLRNWCSHPEIFKDKKHDKAGVCITQRKTKIDKVRTSQRKTSHVSIPVKQSV